MKVILFSDDHYTIMLVRILLGTTSLPSAFELSVIRDAATILDGTDFADLSTAILIDMGHMLAEFVFTELNLARITQKLIVGTLCRPAMIAYDIQFGWEHGAIFYFARGMNQ